MLTFPKDEIVTTMNLFDFADAVETDGVCNSNPQLRIPIFQRENVWSDSQYTALWDSLLRRLPIGSIIVTDFSVPARKLAISKIDVPPKELERLDTSSMQQFYIIDGQQRSAAIAAGLTPFHEKMNCRLWIDLAPPEKQSIESEQFNFFICTKVFPWGEGTEDSVEVDKARAKLIVDNIISADDFDCEISLKHTWPIKAKAPIPFAELVMLIRSNTGEVDVEEFLNQLIEDPLLGSRLGSLDIELRGKVQQNLIKIQEGLRRCARIVLIKASFEKPEDLVPAFIRLNTRGTDLKPAELFYSVVKNDVHEMHDLVSDVWEDVGRIFTSLDIVYAATRLAVSNVSKPVEEPIELSLESIASIKKSPSWDEFTEKIRALFINSELTDCFQTLRKILVYEPNNNVNGLPIPLIIRLDKHSWHPIFRWLWGRTQNRQHSKTTVPSEDALKFLLFDHFFVTKYSDAIKRELPQSAEGYGLKGEGFPYEIFKNEYYKDENPEDWSGAYIRLPDESEKRFKNGDTVVKAPYSTDDYQEFVEETLYHYKYIYEVLKPEDLLIWAERKKLYDWFGKLFSQVSLWRAKLRPFDDDHLVPKAFFNNISYDLNIEMIEKMRLHPAADWNTYKQLRDSIGNRHLYPVKLNRSAGSAGVVKKIEESSDKYSRNHPLSSIISGYKLEHWQQLSLLTDTWGNWEKTPTDKWQWNNDNIVAFKKAVDARRREIYNLLYSILT